MDFRSTDHDRGTSLSLYRTRSSVGSNRAPFRWTVKLRLSEVKSRMTRLTRPPPMVICRSSDSSRVRDRVGAITDRSLLQRPALRIHWVTRCLTFDLDTHKKLVDPISLPFVGPFPFRMFYHMSPENAQIKQTA